MKEVVNTVGTIVTIVALVMAALIGATLLKVFAGIGIVYVMFFHDEYVKTIALKEANDEYNREVDAYNAAIDAENEKSTEEYINDMLEGE